MSPSQPEPQWFWFNVFRPGESFAREKTRNPQPIPASDVERIRVQTHAQGWTHQEVVIDLPRLFVRTIASTLQVFVREDLVGLHKDVLR